MRGLRRRDFLELAALAALAGPAARGLALPAAAHAQAADPDATLQAFADTILPGRPAERTALGNPIHPGAIAGVDSQPGAVEADALALYHHPLTGFDALEGPFLAELEARSLPEGAPFLALDFAARERVCIGGLSFDNPVRVIWEAASAVPFTAFCAAALVPGQEPPEAVGYAVMGHSGAAPDGYRRATWGRRLARERTRRGYLR